VHFFLFARTAPGDSNVADPWSQPGALRLGAGWPHQREPAGAHPRLRTVRADADGVAEAAHEPGGKLAGRPARVRRGARSWDFDLWIVEPAHRSAWPPAQAGLNNL